ncbi:hypothetical protein ACIQUQ_04445 [Streptomyces sp. NPDC101118]|uniref:hypothetical protein n=1 Tax=Streptomyces sp. NPDC101118 TaxID=3366109 RepID=UPI003801519F
MLGPQSGGLAAVATTAEPNLIELRDLPSGAVREAVPAPGPVACLAFGPDGSLVAVAGGEVLVFDLDVTAFRLP